MRGINGDYIALIGEMVPIIDAFEELIIFSDPKCYEYMGGNKTNHRFSDTVNFRNLS